MKRLKSTSLMLSALLLAPAVAAAGASSRNEAERLTDHVRAILAADFAGDRAELARRAQAMEQSAFPAHQRNAEYWIGFAHWRRAINGFNETPTPTDLTADLVAANEHFRAASRLDPAWIEPKIALAGGVSYLGFLMRNEPASPARNTLLGEYLQVLGTIQTEGADNPRALWIVAGHFMAAPPPYRDLEKARASLRDGLARARAEALRPAPEPWVPSWGAPELMMSAAYFHAHIGTPDRDLARAYAEGALALAPTWHYVRDILLPQIEALPEPAAPPAQD